MIESIVAILGIGFFASILLLMLLLTLFREPICDYFKINSRLKLEYEILAELKKINIQLEKKQFSAEELADVQNSCDKGKKINYVIE